MVQISVLGKNAVKISGKEKNSFKPVLIIFEELMRFILHFFLNKAFKVLRVVFWVENPLT